MPRSEQAIPADEPDRRETPDFTDDELDDADAAWDEIAAEDGDADPDADD